MPYLPELYEGEQTRSVVEQFGGYNHNLRIAEGEWYDDLNLTSDVFPMFARRNPRSVYRDDLGMPQGMLAKDALAWVDGGVLYFNGLPVNGLTLSVREEDSPKQLVSMGAYLCIFPDNKWYNTKDGSFGSMGAQFTNLGSVTLSPCKADGSDYDALTVGESAPADPKNGDYWMDTTSSPHALKQYSAPASAWVEVATTYVRIASIGIGFQFAQYDGVTIRGIKHPDADSDAAEQADALNTDAILYGVDDDYIVVAGVLDELFVSAGKSLIVERKVPRMDYVCECNNRLWGCFYGMSEDGTLNEIYACKLGDFKNWNCYMGVSTDSYRASVGTDGAFTGAITYAGMPHFFKENCVHKIYGNYPSNFQLQTTACRGVQKGSWRSMAIVNEVLYYKSRQDVCAYDGSLPVGVSAQLGSGVLYSGAVAGAFGGKYYIAMKHDGKPDLFVYDTVRGIWHRESAIDPVCFAQMDDSLLVMHGNLIEDLNGQLGDVSEKNMEWSATSGIIGYELIDQQYVSRFNLRMRLGKGALCKLEIQYDSDGIWRDQGTVSRAGTDSFVLPVIPRRCDHFMMRLSGRGDVKIFSMAKIIERGSDV